MPTFDATDEAIVARRVELFNQDPNPRDGDYVEFADKIVRRISHVFGPDWENPGVQTSDEGSWYLGNGYCSFSGSLYPMVKTSTLTLTYQKKSGRVWIFHHDHHTAHNGVDTEIQFRVYKCSENAPK